MSSALTIANPYVARSVRALALTGARALRYNLMRKYGGKAGVAARMIGMAWRSRRRFASVAGGLKRRKLNPGRKWSMRLIKPSNRAAEAAAQAYEQTAIQVLFHRQQVRQLPYPATTQSMLQFGSRRAASIKLTGVKICRNFTNIWTSPVIVHWGMIQPKETSQDGSYDFTNLFFRNRASINDCATSFPTDPVQQNTWSALYNCAPWNPDSNFKIITHIKIKLDAANRNRYLDTRTHEKFYKLGGTKAHFRTAANVTPEHPIFEVWYVTCETPSYFDASANPIVTTHGQHQMYFKNVN